MKKIAFTLLVIIFTATVSHAKTLTLNEVVKCAINNNYLIKAQEENLEAAKSKYLSSISNMFPRISFSYTYTHLKYLPYAIIMGIKSPVNKKEVTEWFLRLSQPIFTGFALSTEKEISKLGVNLNKIYKRETILDIALNAKIAYFKVLFVEKQLKVAEETVNQLKAHLKNAEQFYKEQLIPLDDLLKSKVALANAIQNEIKAKNNLKIAKAALNVVLGENIDRNFSLKDVTQVPQTNPYHLDMLYKEAIENNPLISAIKIQIEQARLNGKLAASSYYPHVSIFAEYEQKGSNLLASSNEFTNQHNAMIGIQINWQIFDSFKTHYDIEQAKHTAFALEEKMANIIQNIKLRTKEAYLNLQTAINNIKTARVALKEAKENYRITVQRYKNQMATSTDVLDARTYLTQAETNYYSSLYGYYMEKAKLERVLGKY